MKRRLLFLGPPGAGKGTQAKLLCKQQNLVHLSTGDLLRSEVAAGSPLGKKAAEVMNRGELVSDLLVLSIVEDRLVGLDQGWLLDGFPRNVSQAKALEDLLLKISQPIEAVVVIQVNDDVLLERLLARGRADDSEQVIRHRLEVYQEKTAPLVDFYSKKGLITPVLGAGQVEEISRRISRSLI